MRNIWITALVLLLLVGSCQSSRPNLGKQVVGITALHGTDISKLNLEAEGSNFKLEWQNVSSSGEFIRIHLPDTHQNYQPNWESTENFIHIALPGEGFLDIGVAALKGHVGESAHFTIKPNSPIKDAASAPVGDLNKVDSLVAYQLEDGVRLEWTEINIGDYNFDGEVSVADLTPIAVNFGETYPLYSPDRKQSTHYWVDGDRNGEVNMADVVPIVLNYEANVNSYKVFNGLTNATTASRSNDAQYQNQDNEHLPPLYSVLVDGLATDPWAVAPVDSNLEVGVLSEIAPIVIDEFQAAGSLVITGLDLYQFEIGTENLLDSGHSLMRLIWPGEDIDSGEIGDIIEGNSGSFVLNNIPMDQEIALEITFAPVLDLLTGQPFSEDPIQNEALSLENPVTVKSLFVVPGGSSSFNMQPRIHLSPNESLGYNIDLSVDTSWETGRINYDARLDFYNFRVAAKPVNMADYMTRPQLRDTNRDFISDAKDREIADVAEYGIGLLDPETLVIYKGRVSTFDEPSGTLVMTDPWIINYSGGPGGSYPAPQETIEFNFTEYTVFKDEKSPQHFVPSGVEGSVVTISVYVLIDESGVLPLTWWANSITRTDL